MANPANNALLPYGRTPTQANNTRDLGTSTRRWRKIFLGTSVVLQGSSYATTLGFTAPTAARTVTFPDASGTVVLSGATNTFTVAPSVVVDDSTNTAVTRGLTLSHTTSNTAQAGVGAGLLLRAESGAGTLRSAAAFDGIHTDVTDGAEVSAGIISAGIGGTLFEVARFAAAASSVNGAAITGSATGDPVRVAARGSDTDVSIVLQAKGAARAGLVAGSGDNAFSVGTGGVFVDSDSQTGATPTVSRNSGIVRVQSGNTSVTVTNTLCTANSKIFAQIRNATSNAVSVLRVEPSAGSFVITLSGNPGASHADIAFFMLQPD